MSIFVELTSYKNFDVSNTIRDCIVNCKDRENLYFGLCLQQDEPLQEELQHERIKSIIVPFKESPGPGWARSQAQSLYDGQDYVLRIDSGCRFAQNWDEELISALNSVGSEKAIISNYANRLGNNQKEVLDVAFKPLVYQFLNNVPHTWPGAMKGITSPVKGRWISDHFFFAKGQHCLECKFDPELYYAELEASTTLASFALGYDIFHYHKPVVWREYNRLWNWQDDPNWWLKDFESKRRFSKFLSEIENKEYPLAVRNLKDYELFAGIDFLNKRLQKSTVMGQDPPCNYQNEEQWDREYMKDWLLTAKWDFNQIEKSEDLDYWQLFIEDTKGNMITRQDIRPDRDKDIIEGRVNVRKLAFKTIENRIPENLLIVPMSKGKGELKRSRFSLKGE